MNKIYATAAKKADIDLFVEIVGEYKTALDGRDNSNFKSIGEKQMTSYQQAIALAERAEEHERDEIIGREKELSARKAGWRPTDEILSRQFGGLKYIDLYGNRRQDEELAYKFFQWCATILSPH